MPRPTKPYVKNPGFYTNDPDEILLLHRSVKTHELVLQRILNENEVKKNLSYKDRLSPLLDADEVAAIKLDQEKTANLRIKLKRLILGQEVGQDKETEENP